MNQISMLVVCLHLWELMVRDKLSYMFVAVLPGVVGSVVLVGGAVLVVIELAIVVVGGAVEVVVPAIVVVGGAVEVVVPAIVVVGGAVEVCLLYTSPSPRDATLSRMPSSA